MRFGRCHFWHPEHNSVQHPAETADTASVVSTAGTTLTPHASAERTAYLEKFVSQSGSLMSALQDLLNEALAAGVDGQIKRQAAELQELEDARQKEWVNECAAVTDKLAHIREPEASSSTRSTVPAQIASRGGDQVLVQDPSPWRATTCSSLVMMRRCQPESLESIGADDVKLEGPSLAAASPKDTVKQRKDLKVHGEGDLDVERSRMMEKDASLERLEVNLRRRTDMSIVDNLLHDVEFAKESSGEELRRELDEAHLKMQESVELLRNELQSDSRHEAVEAEVYSLRQQVRELSEQLAQAEMAGRSRTDIDVADFFQRLGSVERGLKQEIRNELQQVNLRMEEMTRTLQSEFLSASATQLRMERELSNNGGKLWPDAVACPSDAIPRVVETPGMGAHRTCPHIPTPDKLQELQELHNQLESELATERRASAELRDAMQQGLRRCEDRLAACVEAEIESRLAQWRGCMDERRASIAEQITAGGKELKQGFEAHAENLKDILAQSCRAGMARLTDLEVKAEEFDAGLVSQQDMEDRVNKLDALISGSLQNAAGECNSFRARFEHLESQLNAAMGDTGWTHICDELRKLQDEAKSQSDGMRELEKRLERQADELRADLKSHEQVTIGLVLNHLPEKDEAPHRNGRNRRR